MNRTEFFNIAKISVGDSRGWQKRLCELARDMEVENLSQPTISNINRNEDQIISEKVANSMRKIRQSKIADFSNDSILVTDNVVCDPDANKNDQQIIEEIAANFSLFDECVHDVVCGTDRGCIISSPPGSGKSHTTAKHESKARGVFLTVTGGITPPEMYKVLYSVKDDGIVIFDDCDDVFLNESGFNLLKGSLETKGKRLISWLKSGKILDEDENEIPKTFEFNGRILFLTNKDFDYEISRGTKLVPHFKALLSRCGYLSLGLNTQRRQLLRIKQVCGDTKILELNGAPFPHQKKEIIEFIEENVDKFRELSLRLAVQIASTYERRPTNWKAHVKAKFMKKN